MKSKHWSSKILLCLLIILLLVFAYSIYNIIVLGGKYNESRKNQEEAASFFYEDNTNGLNVEIIEQNLYDLASDDLPFNFSLDRLVEENEDCIGWIKMPDTPIDYAVMQTVKDEGYYLHRSFKKGYDFSGTPFMSAENTLGGDLQNYIIYGHRMNNGTLFSCLKNLRNQGYYEEHPYFWLVLREERYDVLYLCNIFSVRAVTTNNLDLWTSCFSSQDEKDGYIQSAINNSSIKPTEAVDKNLQLVTLSTCDYSLNKYTGRLLVSATTKEVARVAIGSYNEIEFSKEEADVDSVFES